MDQIDEISEVLWHDGVVSVPTDTVFGLCARMNSQLAQTRLAKVKNRPARKLFPVMCADLEQVRETAVVDARTERIIDALMPGPLTVVLPTRPDLPRFITNGDKTIAIRLAPSEFLRELTERVGPLFMNSANQSGNPQATTLEEIECSCPLVDVVVEGEVKAEGEASTIVRCVSLDLEILRPGPITLAEIQEVALNI